MSDKNETIADIVAEMRQGFDQSWHDIDREWAYGLADRIEAAAKREMSKMASKNVADFGQFGNVAKMREAVETVRKYVKETTLDKVMLGVIEVWCDEALSAPPRQCDMGTAEEQGARLRRFCLRQKWCDRCPLRQRSMTTQADCKLLWAQMPYDESEAKK